MWEGEECAECANFVHRMRSRAVPRRDNGIGVWLQAVCSGKLSGPKGTDLLCALERMRKGQRKICGLTELHTMLDKDGHGALTKLEFFTGISL